MMTTSQGLRLNVSSSNTSTVQAGRRKHRNRIHDERRKENEKVNPHRFKPTIRARPEQRAQNNFGITSAEERTITSC